MFFLSKTVYLSTQLVALFICKSLFKMSKCSHTEMEEDGVEKHDGAFAGPLAIFATLPHLKSLEKLKLM